MFTRVIQFFSVFLILISTTHAECALFKDQYSLFVNPTFISCDAASDTCFIKPTVVWIDGNSDYPLCTSKAEVTAGIEGYPYASICSERVVPRTLMTRDGKIPGLLTHGQINLTELVCYPYKNGPPGAAQQQEIFGGSIEQYSCPSSKRVATDGTVTYVSGGYLYLNQDNVVSCIKSNMREHCPYGVIFNHSTKQCGGNAGHDLQLSQVLNEKPPRPLGAEGDGKSTYNLVAKVTEGGSSKAGMTVNFKVDVIANSGGHDHHDTNRPKGTINTTTAITDTQGEAKLTFTSSEFAGIHTVTATCTNCKPSELIKEHQFDVKVPDLVELPAGDGYTLQGNTSALGRNHRGNHYFTKNASDNLIKFIDTLAVLGWKPVAVDDGSLMWGGRFDIKASWGGSHQEHRTGEEVDISVVRGTDPKKTKSAYDEFCEDKKVEVPTAILWHDVPLNQGGAYPPHFHLRLNGLYSSGKNTGKVAKCSRDSGKQ